MAGRASKYTEVVRADALGELFDKAKVFLNECLDSQDKNDKKWATEQVMKLAAKTVPQQTALTDADGGPLTVNLVSYGNNSTIQLPAKDVPTTATTST